MSKAAIAWRDRIKGVARLGPGAWSRRSRRSSWALAMSSVLAVAVACSGCDGGKKKQKGEVLWDYDFKVKSLIVKNPPAATGGTANAGKTATIVLEGAPEAVHRVSSRGEHEMRQLSTVPFHVTNHIAFKNKYPSLDITQDKGNGPAPQRCRVDIRGMRHKWTPEIDKKDNIEVDILAAELAHCDFLGTSATLTAGSDGAAPRSAGAGSQVAATVSAISDDASNLPIITSTQLADDFSHIPRDEAESSYTEVAIVINNWTVWNSLASVNFKQTDRPGANLNNNPANTIGFSHGGGLLSYLTFLDCETDDSCDSMAQPAAQAYPLLGNVFTSPCGHSLDSCGDTRIQIDSWKIHDSNGRLAAEIKFNWDPWDTNNCKYLGTVNADYYCSIQAAIANENGWFYCIGYNGYNCNYSAARESYGGENDWSELLAAYELAYEAAAALIDPAMVGDVLVTALLAAIELFVDYFDVGATAVIVVTITGGFDCHPDCSHAECENGYANVDDGCGGTCNPCPSGYVCNTSVGICSDCAANGWTCGTDNNGVSCGTCPSVGPCNPEWQRCMMPADCSPPGSWVFSCYNCTWDGTTLCATCGDGSGGFRSSCLSGCTYYQNNYGQLGCQSGCTPRQCDGQLCGSDGCGGQCGCSSPVERCVNRTCTPAL